MGAGAALVGRARAYPRWTGRGGGVRHCGRRRRHHARHGARASAGPGRHGQCRLGRAGLRLEGSEGIVLLPGGLHLFEMPAVTANTLTLPRITALDPSRARLRPVRSITTAPRGFEGEGFPVRRAFAGVSLADLDPFIHLDQMGEVEYAPGEPKGTS